MYDDTCEKCTIAQNKSFHGAPGSTLALRFCNWIQTGFPASAVDNSVGEDPQIKGLGDGLGTWFAASVSQSDAQMDVRRALLWLDLSEVAGLLIGTRGHVARSL
jgi:hypothetical protein